MQKGSSSLICSSCSSEPREHKQTVDGPLVYQTENGSIIHAAPQTQNRINGVGMQEPNMASKQMLNYKHESYVLGYAFQSAD